MQQTAYTRQFHRDVYLPTEILDRVIEQRFMVRYSCHARERIATSFPPELAAQLPRHDTVLEVQAQDVVKVSFVSRPGGEEIDHVLLRRRMDSARDCILAVTLAGLVKTVWINYASDQHATLDRSVYTQPPPKETHGK